MEEEKCNVLIDGLQRREEFIRIERDNNNYNLGVFLEVFQLIMEENWCYEHISRGPQFASHPDYIKSFYSDISVSPVNCVAIYMKLQLPRMFNDEFQTSHWKDDTCYAKVIDPPTGNFRRNDFYFEDSVLIPEKVKATFNSFVRSAVPIYNRNRAPKMLVRIQAMGEDSTLILRIRNSSGQVIQFTLVPVIPCIVTSNRFGKNRVSKIPSRAILVPKPYDFRKSRRAASLSEEDINELKSLWQLKMYERESSALRGRNCAKEVIKLLKLLRSKERWFTLDRYCLKTIVMTKIFESPHLNLWEENMLVKRLEEALEFLIKCISKRELNFIFQPSNMFATMRFEPLFAGRVDADIITRIDEILNLIRDDHVDSVNLLRAVFLNTETRHT